MYFELIRQVVERLIESEEKVSNESRATVLRKCRECADELSEQYRSVSPSLRYADPHCRIGYLFRQGAANAYMFQDAYANKAISKKLQSSGRRTLRILAIGGGPGTELLGLTAILCGPYRSDWPKRVKFLVVDRVSAWTKTLRPLVRVIRAHFKGVAKRYDQKVPKISTSFLALDILAKDSRRALKGAVNYADIVVLNYVLSENKDQLDAVARLARRLKKAIPVGSLVLVIDRAEGDGVLTEAIQSAFDDEFGTNVGVAFAQGTIGEQAVEMGSELLDALGTPRLVLSRDSRPNAFWMVWEKAK